MKTIVLYGATGFTGRLIAREAVRRGVAPVLAGRSAVALEAMGRALALPWKAATVEAPGSLLSEPCVLLNAAGPFVRTVSLAEAAVAAGCDYVDIAGEVETLAAVRALDGAAKARGVTLLPGAGFDIVPSDGLAAHLRARVGPLRTLDLAFRLPAAMSRGTLRIMADAAASGVAMTEAGRLRPLDRRALSERRPFQFDDGSSVCAPVRWGDLATAEARSVRTWLGGAPYRMLAPLNPWLGKGRLPAAGLVEAMIGMAPEGPSMRARAANVCRIAAVATGEDGRRAAAAMTTPDAYDLTGRTALDIALRVARGEAAAGWLRPSEAFGADYVLDFGARRFDLAAD